MIKEPDKTIPTTEIEADSRAATPENFVPPNGNMHPLRSSFITIVTLCIIIGAAVAVIAYGRGYRIDLKQNSLKPTGLISATSEPVGSQVFVDGNLKTATNNSFAIDPGFYTVRISKEGYISWEKKLRIQGEVVSRADAFLFPNNPSLSPLTTVGIEHPTLSPDGTKVAYTIPVNPLEPNKKSGLWYYELSEGPLGRNRDPIQLGADEFDFSHSQIIWSPDATELLVQNTTATRLYNVARPGTYTDATLTRQSLFAEWETERKSTEKQKLAAFKQPIIDIATGSARIISFSPDETKILYEATASATIPIVINPPLIGTNPTTEDRAIKPGKLYVYDSKEDKNYFLLDNKEITPSPTPTLKGTVVKPTPTLAAPANAVVSTPIHWFPTSKHLLLTLQGKIDVLEYDRTNWITIYSGPFADNFVAPWNNGSRIIILTNLNGDAQSLPNLYTVNLR